MRQGAQLVSMCQAGLEGDCKSCSHSTRWHVCSTRTYI
jgi:hypothetical protein